MLLMAVGAVPLLVIVINWEDPIVPGAVAPNTKLAGDGLTD